MILGTAARVRPVLDLSIGLNLDLDLDPLVTTTEVDPPARPVAADGHAGPEAGDHRDPGRFLSPRLYPTAPFDPWEPASS